MTDDKDGSAAQAQAARAEDIFRRYPAITKEEAQEALIFLKRGRHLDVGRVTGMAELQTSIEAFRHDHRRALRVGIGEYAMFAAGVFLFIGGLFWVLAG
ncbi:hypothetical protein [Sphingopyxis indica]|uniref:Uncharacterized protein n=1 Tax=Sphingopyxis indica TaxID=436663 RepID=A0A239D914_9SPHN|nr:hypothetical protein [Sphingopyxis indica]SNS28789.1 hypothetical protein SAMN06295955_101153 [Sphingopyxis indica]